MKQYTLYLDSIPVNVDVQQLLNDFSAHKHHLGAWLDTPVVRSNKVIPPPEYTSHVVREVSLNASGGLQVTFEILNTPRGWELDDKYQECVFNIVPVLNLDGTDILRFDIVQE